MNFLNTREKKKLLEQLSKQFGIRNLKLDYIFFKTKDKIYILSNDYKNLDDNTLRINSLGLYFARIHPEGIRLSIEGSQLIGKLSTQNIIELNKTQIKEWVQGFNIKINKEGNSFVLIKHNNDFFGCGKLKDNKVINHVPKPRRIKKNARDSILE